MLYLFVFVPTQDTHSFDFGLVMTRQVSRGFLFELSFASPLTLYTVMLRVLDLVFYSKC